MTTAVTVDQLRNLTDRAAHGLTPDEQARLRDGIDALHAERADARQKFATVAAQRDRLRTRMNTLADRWERALGVDKPYARTLRAEISIEPFGTDDTPSRLARAASATDGELRRQLAGVRTLLATGQIGCCAHLVRHALGARPANGTTPADPEPSDPAQCTGEEGFCPEHGFHRHSLKQPGVPDGTDTTEPAGLHDRLAALQASWIKAGPPPLGTSINRWWDRRLAELHAALNPKGN